MKSSLTLKNIYRLLTVQDYPVFGPNLFMPADLKGLTLYRFWDQVLAEGLRSGRTGALIWRQSGPRNRYLSSMCNGSCSPGLYKRYLSEILPLLTPDLLLQQTKCFMRFFRSRRADTLILHDKLSRYLTMIRPEISFSSSNIFAYLNECLRRFSAGEDPDKEGAFFFLSLHLTILTLICLAGTESVRPGFLSSLTLPAYAPGQIRSLYSNFRTQNESFQILTDQGSLSGHFGISDLHFFGRENELFELQETLRRGDDNYLICGGAGIGKTELLYQLINACGKADMPCCAALIHYDHTLADSLLKTFPFIHASDKAGAIYLLHLYLEDKARANLILFVDNMVKNKEDQAELSFLHSIGCRIYATSREPSIAGFTSFPLAPLSVESCLLIFRDLYTHPLSPDNIMQLRSLFTEKDFLHTLTVRMLASAANYHRWTPNQLPAAFEEQDISLLQTAPGGTSLRTVYRNLFRKAAPSESVRHMMALAAFLPQQPIPRETFLSWLGSETARQALDQLILQSWVREDDRGISIHPLIRAAFTSHSLSWLKGSSLLSSLIDSWKQSGGYPVTDHVLLPDGPREDLLDLSDFLYAIALHMKSPLPPAFFDVMTEVMLLRLISYRSTDKDPLFEKMAQQTDLSDLQLLRFLSVLLYIRTCPDSLFTEAESLCSRILSEKEQYSALEELFLCLFAKYLAYSNDERFPEIAESLYEHSGNQAVRVLSCILLSARSQFAMDAEGMLTWLEKGRQCITDGNLQQTYLQLQWLEGYCNFLQATMQAEPLLASARQLQELSEALTDKEAEWLSLYYQGSILIHDPSQAEQGIAMLEKARDIAMNIAQDDFSILFLNKNLAIGYEKTAQFERSEKIYLDSIRLLHKYPNRIMDLQQYENNLAVLYQHWGKWEQSLPLLEASLEKALQFDSAISIAEPRNNLSKYYHHIGDFEKEKELLREVIPVFRSVYGDEHSKTAEALQRLG